MKALFVLTFVFYSIAGIGKTVSPDIVGVVSIDSWKDTEFKPNINPNYRFRAINYKSLSSENLNRLVVEKIYHGGAAGANHKVIFSNEVNTMDVKVINKEYKSLSLESNIGCCEVKNIKWDGFTLLYNMKVKNTYLCKIVNVNKNLTPNCKLR